jgi:hypothetical protein
MSECSASFFLFCLCLSSFFTFFARPVVGSPPPLIGWLPSAAGRAGAKTRLTGMEDGSWVECWEKEFLLASILIRRS